MKPFTKRLALVMGLLFTALICCGIVFIDTTQNYWYVNDGFVKLIVSNQTSQAIMTVDTNTFRVGFNTNNATFSFMVKGRTPTNTTTGVGASAVTAGTLRWEAGNGGDTTIPTTGVGGAAGTFSSVGGTGGSASFATTNATGGSGGGFVLTAGPGGANAGSVATNSITGGNGGAFSLNGGAGGAPNGPATNTVSGNGGSFTLTAGQSASPTAGWARKTGPGGGFALLAGPSGNSTRTNSGDGGNFTITAGNSGNVSTAPGNPGIAGKVNISGGAGGTGDTNANGGGIFLAGGASSATPGNVYVGRSSGGTAVGGLVVGLGEFTITNMLGGSASLDFPSTAAGTFSELTIAVTGTTSNSCSVVLGIPWQMAQTGGAFVPFTSNDVVYVRFINNQLVTAIDPTPGTVTAIVLKNR